MAFLSRTNYPDHEDQTTCFTIQRALKGENGNGDLPIFSLGKWDLGHWDWESQTQNWEWETCLEISQHTLLMLKEIPELI